ncbi:MAG: FimV family protein [Promethearchaeota archaeon]
MLNHCVEGIQLYGYKFGRLVMSYRRENWVYCCLGIVIVLGSFVWFVNPIFAILIVIIAILTISIIYVYRSLEYEAPTEAALSEPSTTEEEKAQIVDTDRPQTLKLELPSQGEKKPSAPQLNALKSESLPERDESIRELQKRIAELEQRVQSLRQLASDSIPENDSRIPVAEESRENEFTEEELSEKAIQQLLETLDEKLAKRAISKQLYTRLRDKYIVRIEKTKKRRKASLMRGTKDPNTGDT